MALEFPVFDRPCIASCEWSVYVTMTLSGTVYEIFPHLHYMYLAVAFRGPLFLGVCEIERFQTALMTFKTTRGHW